jgi:endonuclease/exonuclease/phosphatase (EEP) superfamily protein YafD
MTMTESITDAVEQTTRTKPRSNAISASAWLIVVASIPFCCAWVLGRWVYWFDVVASQQMLVSWCSLGALVLVAVVRRWKAAACCLLLVVVSLYPVVVSRTMILPGVDFDHKPTGVLRVITCNINPENELWRSELGKLLDLKADIVVGIEVSPEMSRSIDYRGAMEDDRYPFRSFRKWVMGEVSAAVVFSKWPIEDPQPGNTDQVSPQLHLREVQHESGPLLIDIAHPASPRNPSRWHVGNKVVSEQLESELALHNNLGLPMIVCVDLNAGPAQIRAQSYRSSGFSMSKPLIYMDGSFPSNSSLPRFMRVQLDDVWHIGSIQPIAWTMLRVEGSDHQAVVVDFLLEQQTP